MKKILSIVVTEDLIFEKLTNKIEKAFQVKLTTQNRKGRLIAEGAKEHYKISLIDRNDDLGEFMSDEYHVLDIIVEVNDSFDNLEIENDVRSHLSEGSINWEKGVWSRLDRNETIREIFPTL